MARKASPGTRATKAVAKRKTVTKKTVKKSAPKKTVTTATKKLAKTATAKPKKAPKTKTLDLSGFPTESLVTQTLGLCLACALDVLTRHMGLSAERAQSEIRRHNPALEELSTTAPARPYFEWPAETCPYCAAPAKWHAPLGIVRIEGGKTTDGPRRSLLKEIDGSSNFTVIEEKSTERDALYDWLAKTGANLDLDSQHWLLEATRHWLGRRLKNDWTEIFKSVRVVRRSRQLEDEFELEAPRLFLSPALFDEVLLIQYLLSRSHKAGGLTFEGRLTLQDLFHRLRGGGYLHTMGITARNPSDALEQLVELLGGESRVKFHYIIDRRVFLERLAGVKSARVPRSKQPSILPQP